MFAAVWLPNTSKRNPSFMYTFFNSTFQDKDSTDICLLYALSPNDPANYPTYFLIKHILISILLCFLLPLSLLKLFMSDVSVLWFLTAMESGKSSYCYIYIIIIYIIFKLNFTFINGVQILEFLVKSFLRPIVLRI